MSDTKSFIAVQKTTVIPYPLEGDECVHISNKPEFEAFLQRFERAHEHFSGLVKAPQARRNDMLFIEACAANQHRRLEIVHRAEETRELLLRYAFHLWYEYKADFRRALEKYRQERKTETELPLLHGFDATVLAYGSGVDENPLLSDYEGHVTRRGIIVAQRTGIVRVTEE